MKLILTAAIALIILTGCASTADITEDFAEELGEGIQRYCDEFDQDSRMQFREMVNRYSGPHSAKIICR